MKEPYREGVASHMGPESCVGGRKSVGEASIGVRAGWVLSRENITSERRRSHWMRKATSAASPSRDADRALRGLRPHARTETPHAEPGRSRVRPPGMARRSAVGIRKEHATDA